MTLPAAPLAMRWPVLGAAATAVILFGIFLLMRYAGTLGGVRSGMALMCIGMIALPWLLLSRHGRAQIGLRRAARLLWYPIAIGVGAGWALVCYLLGTLLFGAGAEHWFVTVAQTYRAYPVASFSKVELHLMFTIPAVLFSPIGEEIFFRGYLQKVFEPGYGRAGSACSQSSLFGAVHLLHHGLVITAAGLTLLPASAALWVALMSGFALLSSWLRLASKSLLPAMLGHAAFNAAMNALIFAYLWR
ncbi:MAG: CPBP family intramembrane glutamic endopeptidase [Pseudomonadota bacterium]